jgi:hypothetical protein
MGQFTAQITLRNVGDDALLRRGLPACLFGGIRGGGGAAAFRDGIPAHRSPAVGAVTAGGVVLPGREVVE